MKKIAFLLLFCSGLLSAQVGINTTTPSPASVLHLESLNGSNTHGGFMPPVVDQAGRDSINAAITAADDGMMIYYSDGTTRCVQFYNAQDGIWVDMYCMPVPPPPSLTYYQDFETISATPELTYMTTGGGGSITTTNNGGANGYEVQGSNAHTISFDPIDSSLFTNNTLSFDLSAIGGVDTAEYVEVTVNDGVTVSTEVIINGFSNASWTFAPSAVASTTYDGDNTPTSFSANGNDYSKVVLSGLPSSGTLSVEIKFFTNSASEFWVIDNVILSLN